MTVIVWDGVTLAADKQATQSDLARRVKKIRRIRGNLVGASGQWDLAQEMFDWFAQGAKRETWPATQRTDDKWVGLLVITPSRKILKYESSPIPIDFTANRRYAFGSGRDFAYGAMEMGADARAAVLAASKFDINCGMGVDTLTLEAR
jgi:ATP-dependent protease HslVU (ClpYQ) peptidase subunit